MTSDDHVARAPTTGADTDIDPHDGRDESENERHDRNWTEILQELRVIQTGTQILTGFLLALAFQPRFTDLDDYQVATYLTLVVVATIGTALALAPVSLHRFLFRRKAKGTIVTIANRLLKVTLAAVGLTFAGTTMLIFDVVVNHAAGLIAGSLAVVIALLAWVALPVIVGRAHPND